MLFLFLFPVSLVFGLRDFFTDMIALSFISFCEFCDFRYGTIESIFFILVASDSVAVYLDYMRV